MDILSFQNSPTLGGALNTAHVVTALDSILWTERFDGGSFAEFTSSAVEFIRQELAIGTFVSHTNTAELLVVTKHHITETRSGGASIKISATSYLDILGRRIVGFNHGSNDYVREPYILIGMNAWEAASQMLADHLLPAEMETYVSWAGVPGLGILPLLERPGDLYDRDYDIPPEPLSNKVREILSGDGLGIKTVRQSQLAPIPVNVAIIVHDGIDRSGSVSFSVSDRILDTAEYVWLDDGFYDSVMVTTKWYRKTYLGGTGAGIHMTHLDLSHIDDRFAVMPDPYSDDEAHIFTMMDAGAYEFLRRQKRPDLFNFVMDRQSPKYVCRVHYNVGDIVTVSDRYHYPSKRRVVEFVEIVDGEGYRAYPTLEAL